MHFAHVAGTRLVRRRGRWTGAAVTLWMLAMPASTWSMQLASVSAVAPNGTTPGYPTSVWTELPPTIVSEVGYRAGFGTGMTLAGETVEVRPGSPFAR